MSKKPKGRKRLQLTAEAASTAAETSAVADAGTAITKAQKRKLQKKRAKVTAMAEREAADAERAAHKEARTIEKAARAAAAPAPSVPHPVPEALAFSAAEDDHCETAPEAYSDIAPILSMLAARLGKTPATLRIYDPYFCNGAVVRHLNSLGYDRVHNVNEDFYAVLAAGNVPEHDVIVTNPPYSGSHPEQLLSFLARNAKPWLALMPNWVSDKAYYMEDGKSYYVWPTKRYHYWTPKGRRTDVASGGAKAKTHGHTNAALGARTSPFVSFWYGGGLPHGVASGDVTPAESCRMCSHREDLPRSVLDR